jgi:deoxyxylulose-5-phosphate synthase
MPKPASTSTRVAGDVVASASAIAPGEHRTIAEQINYWARIGMQIERSGTVTTRRVLAVAAGEAQFSTLDSHGRETAHALIDAQIAEQAAIGRFGPAARAAGHRTVSLDDDGNLIEITAEGTTRRL